MLVQRTRDAAFVATSLVATLRIAPSAIVHMFGEPTYAEGHAEDGRVSRLWLFDVNDDVVGIHDLKETSLYGRGLPSPTQFWVGKDPVRLCVCGTGNPETVRLFQKAFMALAEANGVDSFQFDK